MPVMNKAPEDYVTPVTFRYMLTAEFDYLLTHYCKLILNYSINEESKKALIVCKEIADSLDIEFSSEALLNAPSIKACLEKEEPFEVKADTPFYIIPYSHYDLWLEVFKLSSYSLAEVSYWVLSFRNPVHIFNGNQLVGVLIFGTDLEDGIIKGKKVRRSEWGYAINKLLNEESEANVIQLTNNVYFKRINIVEQRKEPNKKLVELFRKNRKYLLTSEVEDFKRKLEERFGIPAKSITISIALD